MCELSSTYVQKDGTLIQEGCEIIEWIPVLKDEYTIHDIAQKGIDAVMFFRTRLKYDGEEELEFSQ